MTQRFFVARDLVKTTTRSNKVSSSSNNSFEYYYYITIISKCPSVLKVQETITLQWAKKLVPSNVGQISSFFYHSCIYNEDFTSFTNRL